MKKDCLVICPVHNEVETLPVFYECLRGHYSGNVLFIDDGSTDEGEDFLAGIRDENTLLIRHPARAGYGAALISGFRFSSQGDYRKIITLDVDLQHDPGDVPRFIQALDNAATVLGSRYPDGMRSSVVPLERWQINCYISTLIDCLFSVKFSDPFCGFRGYRDVFLKKAQLSEASYGFGLEMILEVIRTGAEFVEIPVKAVYPDPSRSFLDGLDSPRKRLLHYLEVITRKQNEMEKQFADICG